METNQKEKKVEEKPDLRNFLPSVFMEPGKNYKISADDIPARFKEEESFRYNDMRKDYLEKYNPVINHNPDENINSLVQNILSKQNLLNKNLGKIVKSAVKTKGKH